MSLRAAWRGWIGEKIACLGMWLFLDKRIYRRVHNVIVPSGRGTTQIDHVFVSSFGIFVIETKNMSGWIFGHERDRQWMQVFPGKKFRFQNPLHQNYRHTKSLAEFLRLDHSLFHSIAFFVGDCRFKTSMPPNVMTSGLASYIKKFSLRVLEQPRVEEIVAELQTLRSNPTSSGHEHVVGLKERHESTTTCPRCSRPLKQKIARKGPSAGKFFIGCTGWPGCDFARPIGTSPRLSRFNSVN
jgi:hypothetical protein